MTQPTTDTYTTIYKAPERRVYNSTTRKTPQVIIVLKLEGAALRGVFRAAAAAAAAFSASCLAARKAALRFVLGAMLGALILLRRGFN